MRRGFKSHCESIATAVRAEMGLLPHQRLDARDLAAHLEIPLHPVSSLGGGASVATAIDYVVANSAVFSAMTIFPDWPLPRRVVIFNESNSTARQNSDVAHELSHGLLLHEPRDAIVSGCRDYSRSEEDEAAWLSGCLLVPRAAAIAIAFARTPMGVAAVEYGVSTQMMTYRVNTTGARRQAQAARSRRGRQV